MTGEHSANPVHRARQAAASGEWEDAHDLLCQARSENVLDDADLPFVAEVAYAAGQLDVTIEAWERAHSSALASGNRVDAAGAAVRVALHLLMDTALMAPVRGWLARADRLLENEPIGPVHAWRGVARAYERLLSGDRASAAAAAADAVEQGSTHGEPAAAAIGRVAGARCTILEGRVEEGITALQETGVSILCGELDPISTGIIYCELVCALQALAQYDLAEEWTLAMERWSRVNAIGSIHGRCRVHRSEILRLRGQYAAAEKEAAGACEELRPYLRREFGWPLSELGRIRLQRGDLDGAEEAFSAAHRLGWDPQPGMALLHFARGDTTAAATAIRTALQSPSTLPSKELPPNTELRRAPLLSAAVQIEIAAGELERARLASAELERIAAKFESKALSADATVAKARVDLADGRTTDARARFSEAVRMWLEIRAPFEAAVARRELSDALMAEGKDDLASLERSAADAVLSEIRSGSTAAVPQGQRSKESGVASARSTAEFRLDGDTRLLSYSGQTVRLRDLKGLRYIARLLAEPERSIHVLELVQLESGGAASTGATPSSVSADLGDAGPILDEQAKLAYRRRIAEIEEDLVKAQEMGDLGRAAQVQLEREFLVSELSRAVGLSGRDRRAGVASERARASVTRAIRQAIARIAEHHELLAEHLQRTVQTGTMCSYRPDSRTPSSWRLE